MRRTVEVPVELLEEVADLELPPTAQQTLVRLMDKNNEGRLSQEEWNQLQALVDLNGWISRLKGRARFSLRDAS